MAELPMYGAKGPLWWVKRRGWKRIAHGFCPYCYSSPPRPTCPICKGSRYGRELTAAYAALWASRWFSWCNR